MQNIRYFQGFGSRGEAAGSLSLSRLQGAARFVETAGAEREHHLIPARPSSLLTLLKHLPLGLSGSWLMAHCCYKTFVSHGRWPAAQLVPCLKKK